jgi:hypothetical protein
VASQSFASVPELGIETGKALGAKDGPAFGSLIVNDELEYFFGGRGVRHLDDQSPVVAILLPYSAAVGDQDVPFPGEPVGVTDERREEMLVTPGPP